MGLKSLRLVRSETGHLASDGQVRWKKGAITRLKEYEGATTSKRIFCSRVGQSDDQAQVGIISQQTREATAKQNSWGEKEAEK